MLVPMVIESSARGERAFDIYSRLLKADRLPRRADRGPRREPDHCPAPVPRERGPGEGHHAVHQLAGRCGDQRPAIFDTMQYLKAPSAPSASVRRPAWAPCCWRPARRASASPCRTRGSCSTRVGRLPGQHAGCRDPGQGDADPDRSAHEDHGDHTGQDYDKVKKGRRARLLHECRRGQGLRHHRRGVRGDRRVADQPEAGGRGTVPTAKEASAADARAKK